MSLKQELYTLWDWLLRQGLWGAALVVNLFLSVFFVLAMLFVSWFTEK